MSETDAGPPERRRRRRRTTNVFTTVRRSAAIWGALLFALLVIVLARRVILPFVFAILLAYILAPIVTRLSERDDGSHRMPRGAAILLCYLVLLGSMAGFGMVLIPRLGQDASRMANEVPTLYEKFDEEFIPWLANKIDSWFPPAAVPADDPMAIVPGVPVPPGTAARLVPLPDGSFALQLESQGIEVAERPGGGYIIHSRSEPMEPLSTEEKIRHSFQGILGYFRSELGSLFQVGRRVVTSLIGGIFTFFLVLMVCGFLLLDREKIHSFVRSLVPEKYNSDYDVIVEGVDRGLGGVIRGQLMICLVNGVLTYVGLLIFDVKYSIILAFVAAIMSLIPIFGSILSTIPIVLAAFVSGGEGIDIMRGVFICMWIIGIHFIEANLLNPKIIGDSAKIHPVIVVFALLVGERTWGLTGALLAVPAASIIQVLFLYFTRKPWQELPRAPTSDS